MSAIVITGVPDKTSDGRPMTSEIFTRLCIEQQKKQAAK